MNVVSFVHRIIAYIKDSLYELKRVVWPTRKQAVIHSIVVVIMSVVVSAFLATLDIVFSFGIQRILQFKL